jgi:hypothetical protein
VLLKDFKKVVQTGMESSGSWMSARYHWHQDILKKKKEKKEEKKKGNDRRESPSRIKKGATKRNKPEGNCC